MYELQSRVYVSRADAGGRMKFAGAVEIMQDCSQMWLESEPAFRQFLAERGLGMFLTSRQADVVRLPRYGEPFTVRTSIYDANAFFGYRNTVLYGGDGQPCVRSWCIGAFVSLQTGRLARLPAEQRARITIDPRVDMEYLDKKIPVPELPGRETDPIPVRRSDIDLNRHMNNARYVEAALECLPEDFSIRRMRVEYKKPARYGDRLHPLCIDTADGTHLVLLRDDAGSPYAVLEFS